MWFSYTIEKIGNNMPSVMVPESNKDAFRSFTSISLDQIVSIGLTIVSMTQHMVIADPPTHSR